MQKIFGMILIGSFIQGVIIAPLVNFSILFTLINSIMFYWIVILPSIKAKNEKAALEKYEEYQKKRKEYSKEISGKKKSNK